MASEVSEVEVENKVQEETVEESETTTGEEGQEVSGNNTNKDNTTMSDIKATGDQNTTTTTKNGNPPVPDVDSKKGEENETGGVKDDKKEEAGTEATTTTTTAAPPPPPEKKMRAVCITSYGGVKNVKCVERPQPPSPPEKEGMVTVQVKISGLNFYDLLLRMGYFSSDPGVTSPSTRSPLTLGTELIGEVTEVHPSCTRVKVGDLVFGFLEHGGAFSELCGVEESNLFVIEGGAKSLPMETLVFTLPYLVAQLLLDKVGGAGVKTLLVHSAGGSVGLALKDLANLKGIEVLGVASKEKVETLKGLGGFKEVYERTNGAKGVADYAQKIKEAYPDGIDAVLDSQGGEDFQKGLTVLKTGGIYVRYGNANTVTGDTKGIFGFTKQWWTSDEKLPLIRIIEKNITVSALNLRPLLKQRQDLVEQSLKGVWDLMVNGTLKPQKHEEKVYHFEDMAQAMQRMHERKNIGRILVTVDIPPPPPTPPPQEENKETPATTNGTDANKDTKENDAKSGGQEAGGDACSSKTNGK